MQQACGSLSAIFGVILFLNLACSESWDSNNISQLHIQRKRWDGTEPSRRILKWDTAHVCCGSDGRLWWLCNSDVISSINMRLINTHGPSPLVQLGSAQLDSLEESWPLSPWGGGIKYSIVMENVQNQVEQTVWWKSVISLINKTFF